MKPKYSIRNFGYAFRGIWETLRNEKNMQIHVVAALVIFGAAAYFRVKSIEWVALFLVVGQVIAAELFNTALESIVDFVSPEYHNLARRAKDVSAGAVLVTALMAVAVGLIIFLPPILRLLGVNH